MKSDQQGGNYITTLVAPFAGAWIEITLYYPHKAIGIVAPFAGAWIEIHDTFYIYNLEFVAPFAGAWIEIVIG